MRSVLFTCDLLNPTCECGLAKGKVLGRSWVDGLLLLPLPPPHAPGCVWPLPRSSPQRCPCCCLSSCLLISCLFMSFSVVSLLDGSDVAKFESHRQLYVQAAVGAVRLWLRSTCGPPTCGRVTFPLSLENSLCISS